MKKASCFTVIFLTVVLTICLFGTQGTAGEKIYQMKGEITAIESAYNTVVIEVPMGKRMFTVAGPLSSEAILKILWWVIRSRSNGEVQIKGTSLKCSKAIRQKSKTRRSS
ncbi:MAG: hypothetical protein JRJ79_13770 [Deltaproteobacteria bacterium]|nr:hypothetical protein [Deltaproteobacteria bacterium]